MLRNEETIRVRYLVCHNGHSLSRAVRGAREETDAAMPAKVRIEELRDYGDGRGPSYSVPAPALEYLGRVADVHLGMSKPGAVRGNHYHLRRREAIVVLPGAQWSLHWDNGEGSPPSERSFDGSQAVLVLVETGVSHALRNNGERPLWFIACSSEPYDPAETVARKVV